MRKTKVFKGVVVKKSSDKTINVLVSAKKRHPVYKKVYTISKKYLVHDDTNQSNVGDTVSFVATRPISKNKSFIIVSSSKESKND